jgi:hypothetical protein
MPAMFESRQDGSSTWAEGSWHQIGTMALLSQEPFITKGPYLRAFLNSGGGI